MHAGNTLSRCIAETHGCAQSRHFSATLLKLVKEPCSPHSPIALLMTVGVCNILYRELVIYLIYLLSISGICLPIYHLSGHPRYASVKNVPANAGDVGDTGSIHGLGGYGNPLQHFCLGNPMARGPTWAIVHGGTKSFYCIFSTFYVICD